VVSNSFLPFEALLGSVASLLSLIRVELQILYRLHLLRSGLEFSNLYKIDGKVKKVLNFIDFLFLSLNSLV
jgi:hypothetical protein